MSTSTDTELDRADLDDPVFVPDHPPAELARERERERERAWHEWMGVAVGLSAVLSILALIVSLATVGSTSTRVDVVTVPGASVANGSAPATALVPPVQALAVAIKSDSEHGRLGPDGKWHDAFLPADFTVKAGARVTITFTNYDNGPHTFTSPALGVNQIISGGTSLRSPHVVKLTFTAPNTPGHYAYWCSIPCDPWAMKHDGYMRGTVTVKA